MSTRRQFLSTAACSAGALALAGNDELLHAASAAATAPRRFIFIRKSNGIRPSELVLPTFSDATKKLDKNKEAFEADLHKHELPDWLKALDKHRSHMTILQGLSSKMSENGHFSYSSVMGAFKSARNSLSGIKRATIDFELAKLFPSPFEHIELSLTGNYSSFRTGIVPGYSAPAAHQRNYCYADPQTAYDELFKSVTDPNSVASENQMLEFLQNDEAYKSHVLKGYEKRTLSNHIQAIESIRQRNVKVAKMSASIEKWLPKIDKIHQEGGVNANTPEKQMAMTNILVAALATGLTNIVTYTIDELSTPIRGLPGNESDRISIHEIGHNGGYSGVPADTIREKIRLGHIQQIESIIDQLKKVPEGNGNMFDRTMILYFPENGETHHSHGTEAPFVILAGEDCRLDVAGRYIRLPYHGTKGHKTLSNWYTTLLNAHGNPIPHYGDLDLEMSRKKLDQRGPIRQLMA